MTNDALKERFYEALFQSASPLRLNSQGCTLGYHGDALSGQKSEHNSPVEAQSTRREYLGIFSMYILSCSPCTLCLRGKNQA